MTDDEKLEIMRKRWPKLAEQERTAAERIRAVMGSGDPSRVREGSQALADWIDARCAMVVYYDVSSDLGEPNLR